MFANRGQYRDEPANSEPGWTGLNRGKYLDGGTAALSYSPTWLPVHTGSSRFMNRGEPGWTGCRTVAMPGGPGWSGMFLDEPWAAPAVFDMSKTTGVNRDDVQTGLNRRFAGVNRGGP